MKKLFFLLILSPLGLFAQDCPIPSTAPISSDYGARNNPPYYWHWGIDYDGNMWDKAFSIASGTIRNIGSFDPFVAGGKTYWIWHIDICKSFASLGDFA